MAEPRGLRWTWTQNPAGAGGGTGVPAQRDARTQRLAASGVCLLLAALCFSALYAPVLLLRARKFALLWSLGSALAGGTLLRGGAAVAGSSARRERPRGPRAALRGRARRDAVRRAVSARYVAHSAGRLRWESPHCTAALLGVLPRGAGTALCASRSGAWARAPPARRSPFEARGPPSGRTQNPSPGCATERTTGNQL